MSKAASMQVGLRRGLPSRDGLTAWLLVAPAVLCITVLFIVPIGYVLLLSITDPTVSLDHYRRFFTVPLYANVMVNTFRTSLIVTLACLALGYPLAYVMARRNDAVAVIFLVAVGLSFWTGFVVRTYAWLIILGNKGPLAATYTLAGWGKPPQLLFTSFSYARDDPRPAPLHGARPLWRHAQDRSFLYAGRRGPRRASLRRIPPRLPSAQPARGRQRLRSRVHHVPRLLHHADPARHAQRHDDLPAHQPADRRSAGLGLRLGDRGRPAGVHACAARRLQSLCRPGSAVGIGAMARHVPLVLASLAAIFLVAPMAIIVPMSFSKAISFEFPPPGYWTGYYAQYFSSHSWLEATANSFIIAFGSMALTLIAALPAAFGFVRYRFRGKSMLNLIMMLPIIVPAVVSALGYYSFLSPLRLVGTHAGMIIAHSVLSIPVAFLVIAAALKGFDRNLERAAMSAGAGPLRTFLWVTLPVLRPGILVGALFAFLHSFNEAVVAIFIAGRDASTLPKKMFESIRLESDPVIAVVSTLLTGAVLLGVLISLFFRPRPAQG